MPFSTHNQSTCGPYVTLPVANQGVVDGSKWLQRTKKITKRTETKSAAERSVESHDGSLYFAADGNEPACVILLDDVTTTGHTLTAAANEVLKKWKNAEIVKFAIANTNFNQPGDDDEYYDSD